MFIFIDDNNSKNNSIKSYFWGIVLVVLGVLYLLRNLELINFEIPDQVFSWKIIFVVFTINALLSQKWNTAFLWGGFSLILYAEVLFNVQPFQFKYLWPIIIILIGLAIMGKVKLK